MARRNLITGIAAAALALGVLAGCSEGGGTGGSDTDQSASASAPATGTSESASAEPGTGEDGAAGGALQGQIDKLLEGAPISFAWESAELNDESKATLKKVAEAAAKDEAVKLSIKATAGNADADAAKALSQKRVDAVIKELTANGVAEDRLQGEALGNEGVSGDKQAATTVEISVVS